LCKAVENKSKVTTRGVTTFLAEHVTTGINYQGVYALDNELISNSSVRGMSDQNLSSKID